MWHGVHGHDAAVEHFRQSLRSGRLASTYLFVGPAGIGKRTFALKLAQALLCQNHPDLELEMCGHCQSCKLVQAGTHPDLLQVGRPPDKSFIPVEAFIGSPEKRMREGLCHDIGMKPFLGGRKVALIDDADDLNLEGANSLLKTLEEPPPRSLLILIGTSAAKQLPTIRSRCQIIRFQPLDDEILAELLVSTGNVESREAAQRLVPLSEGSLQRAIELADPQLAEFRQRLLNHLTQRAPDSVRLATAISTFVDEAGREASRRRARLRQLIGFVADYYRELMRRACGAAATTDPILRQAAEKGLAASSGDPEAYAAAIDRCLQALEHVGRNLNQTTIIECWLDDLEQIAITGHAIAR